MRAVRRWRIAGRGSTSARESDAAGTACGRTRFNAKPGSSSHIRRQITQIKDEQAWSGESFAAARREQIRLSKTKSCSSPQGIRRKAPFEHAGWNSHLGSAGLLAGPRSDFRLHPHSKRSGRRFMQIERGKSKSVLGLRLAGELSGRRNPGQTIYFQERVYGRTRGRLLPDSKKRNTLLGIDTSLMPETLFWLY